jgi:hypothetical protein
MYGWMGEWVSLDWGRYSLPVDDSCDTMKRILLTILVSLTVPYREIRKKKQEKEREVPSNK